MSFVAGSKKRARGGQKKNGRSSDNSTEMDTACKYNHSWCHYHRTNLYRRNVLTEINVCDSYQLENINEAIGSCDQC